MKISKTMLLIIILVGIAGGMLAQKCIRGAPEEQPGRETPQAHELPDVLSVAAPAAEPSSETASLPKTEPVFQPDDYLTGEIVHEGRMCSIGDVILQLVLDSMPSKPLVLTSQQYIIMKKIFSASGEPQVEDALKIANYLLEVWVDYYLMEQYYDQEVLVEILPDARSIMEFTAAHSVGDSHGDSQGFVASERFKEAVKQHLLEENMVRLMLERFDRFSSTGRLQLAQIDNPIPWSVQNVSMSYFYQEGAHGGPDGTRETGETYLDNGVTIFTIDGRTLPAGAVRFSYLDFKFLPFQIPPGRLLDMVNRLSSGLPGSRKQLLSWLGCFEPGIRESVIRLLFTHLVRAGMKDCAAENRETYRVPEKVLRKMRLNTLICLVGYTASRVYIKNKGLLVSTLSVLPRLTLSLTGGSYGLSVARSTNFLDVCLGDLDFICPEGRMAIRISSSDPLNVLDMPEEYNRFQLMVEQEVLQFTPRTIQASQNKSVSNVNEFVFMPVKTLVMHRLRRKYPLFDVPGLYLHVTPQGYQVYEEGPPVHEGHAPFETVENLKAMYGENVDCFKIGASYRFQALFHTDREIVEAARHALSEGLDMDSALSTYGITGSEALAAQFYPVELLKPEIAETLASLQTGDYSDVIAVNSPCRGFAALRLLEKREPLTLPFENEMVPEVLTRFHHAHIMRNVMSEHLADDGGFTRAYFRWVWPCDSPAVREMMDQAAMVMAEF